MARGAQPSPRTLTILAPMRERGSMTRFMGRFWMEASPVSTESKFWPHRMPARSRVVVPLFPQSRTPSGRFNPRSPRPCTRIFPSFSWISTPMERKQEMVERQSAPLRKWVISVVPWAREPNMTLRWEMDLSPGMVKLPLREETGENFIGHSSYGINVYL